MTDIKSKKKKEKKGGSQMYTLQTGREQKRWVDEWNWNEVREGHEVMLENVCLIEIVQVASPLFPPFI